MPAFALDPAITITAITGSSGKSSGMMMVIDVAAKS
jgi:UDP-N-acetylmuramoylalanine-D-glutamate ligase